MQLAQQDGLCRDTTLSLSGQNEVPVGLEEYTDGYMATYTMNMGEFGLYYEEFYATCFGAE